MTSYQDDVIVELKELAKVGVIGLAKMQRAINVVKTNDDDMFTEWSGMGTSEAADLAVELA